MRKMLRQMKEGFALLTLLTMRNAFAVFVYFFKSSPVENQRVLLVVGMCDREECGGRRMGDGLIGEGVSSRSRARGLKRF